MKTAIKLRRNGKKLFLAIALLSLGLYACRNSKPPAISIICLGDGFGGADCVLADGTRKYLSPSALKNFWMTTNADMQNFSAWCYQTNPSTAGKVLTQIRDRITEE